MVNARIASRRDGRAAAWRGFRVVLAKLIKIVYCIYPKNREEAEYRRRGRSTSALPFVSSGPNYRGVRTTYAAGFGPEGGDAGPDAGDGDAGVRFDHRQRRLAGSGAQPRRRPRLRLLGHDDLSVRRRRDGPADRRAAPSFRSDPPVRRRDGLLRARLAVVRGRRLTPDADPLSPLPGRGRRPAAAARAGEPARSPSAATARAHAGLVGGDDHDWPGPRTAARRRAHRSRLVALDLSDQSAARGARGGRAAVDAGAGRGGSRRYARSRRRSVERAIARPRHRQPAALSRAQPRPRPVRFARTDRRSRPVRRQRGRLRIATAAAARRRIGIGAVPRPQSCRLAVL